MRRLSLLFFFAVFLASNTGSARTWYITPDGTGDAPTIQAGIDSAAAGDTVLVAAGKYTEACKDGPDGPTMLLSPTALYLISEDGPNVTVLDAQASCRVFWGLAHIIDGFTITGGFVDNPDPLLIISLLALWPQLCYARACYVKPDSTGDAPTIHAGLYSASFGDTVLVAPGIYLRTDDPETNINPGQGVCLTSKEGPEVTRALDTKPKPWYASNA